MQTVISSTFNLPAEAKVWVYQSNNKLSAIDIDLIQQKLSSFIKQWQSHGRDLNGAFKIFYDHFIVLGVDESTQQATGCSIDSSVRIIKELEENTGCDFTDKSYVGFLKNNEVKVIHFREIKKYIEQGEINKETLMFNNHVNTFTDFQSKWLIPAQESWVKRFF